MYITRIDDSYGHHSEAADIDYRYGVKKDIIDINGAHYKTIIDDFGRLISVKSPNESYNANTIAYSYHPTAASNASGVTTPAYSVTTYYFGRTYQNVN